MPGLLTRQLGTALAETDYSFFGKMPNASEWTAVGSRSYSSTQSYGSSWHKTLADVHGTSTTHTKLNTSYNPLIHIKFGLCLIFIEILEDMEGRKRKSATKQSFVLSNKMTQNLAKMVFEKNHFDENHCRERKRLPNDAIMR